MGRRRQMRSGMGRLCTEDVDLDRLTDVFSELVPSPGNSDMCSLHPHNRADLLPGLTLSFYLAAHRSSNMMRSW